MLLNIGFVVLAVLAVVIIGFGIFVSTRPETFRIERSAVIAAPPATVYPLINDFTQWTEWSPWDKLDPTLKRSYEGEPGIPGSTYSWLGNRKVGEGRMTLLEHSPDERVLIKLDFIKPMKATNETTFQLEPAGAGTKVRWIMDGKNTLTGKAFSAVLDMDKMIGKDFEQGLANLNAVAASRVSNRPVI